MCQCFVFFCLYLFCVPVIDLFVIIILEVIAEFILGSIIIVVDLRLTIRVCVEQVIDLIITVAATTASVMLFALILVPMALWVDSSETVIFIGSFLTASLILLAIFATIVFAGLVTLLRVMARRAAVLENRTVIGSIRRSYSLIRGNLKDTVLMGLVAMGVNSFWPASLMTTQ